MDRRQQKIRKHKIQFWSPHIRISQRGQLKIIKLKVQSSNTASNKIDLAWELLIVDSWQGGNKNAIRSYLEEQKKKKKKTTCSASALQPPLLQVVALADSLPPSTASSGLPETAGGSKQGIRRAKWELGLQEAAIVKQIPNWEFGFSGLRFWN